ncbi:MAG: SpoIIE family protein phosphatase [Lentisphaerota bacterium]
MPGDDPFQATMRIDIPPDVLEQLRAPKQAPDIPARKHAHTTVIRIPGKHVDAPGLGGTDFLELLQSIYDAALITDLKGGILSANDRAIQFLQFARDEFLRLNVLGVLSGASESLLATIWDTLQKDRFVLIQACCVRKDASLFPAEISVNRLHLSGKDYLSFFIRDITLRKEAEERLRTGYNAIQNSGNGIAIADIEANIGYCNPAMLRLWGFESPDELRDRNIRGFLVDETQADQIIEAVCRGEAWGGELEMKRDDGRSFYVQASVAPNLNPDGEIAGMVLSLLDISLQKQAQKQLESYAEQLRDKNSQLEDDLNLAREIQQAFLPSEYPAFPRGVAPEESALKFSHLYFPSGAVGGDFFDIIDISDTQAGIFISDVMGHGARAALVVATIRGLIEQLSSSARDPGVFMSKLNEAYSSIFKETSELMFATALYLMVDVTTGIVRYTTAGHPFPFLLSREKGTLEELSFSPGARGPAIGLFNNSIYKNDERQLRPRDLLFFYTDGLSEAKSGNVEYSDSGRLNEILRSKMALPLSQLLNDLVADVREYSGSSEFEDDVCLLAMEWTCASKPPVIIP